MGRMVTMMMVKSRRHRELVSALVDTGSTNTVLSNQTARMLRIKTSSDDVFKISGLVLPICYRTVDIHIPGTDCLVEKMRVAVIADPMHDFWNLIGADFLQRTGAILDFRKDRHAIIGDSNGRDDQPADFVEPRRLRAVGWI